MNHGLIGLPARPVAPLLQRGAGLVARTSSRPGYVPGDGKRLAYVPYLKGVAALSYGSGQYLLFFNERQQLVRRSVSLGIGANGALCYVPTVGKVAVVGLAHECPIYLINPRTGAIDAQVEGSAFATTEAATYLQFAPSTNEVLHGERYNDGAGPPTMVVDVATWARVGPSGGYVTWKKGPFAFAPSTGEVIGLGGGLVIFVNPATRAVAATTGVGATPLALAVDRRLDRVFVAADANVFGFDISSRTLVGTADVGAGVRALYCCPTNGLLYASVDGTKQVVAYDVRRGTVVASVTLSVTADSLAFNPENGCLYAASNDGARLTAIRVSDHRVVAELSLV